MHFRKHLFKSEGLGWRRDRLWEGAFPACSLWGCEENCGLTRTWGIRALGTEKNTLFHVYLVSLFSWEREGWVLSRGWDPGAVSSKRTHQQFGARPQVLVPHGP